MQKTNGGVREASLAERVRTLCVLGGHSSLSTLSRKHPGYPFGSLMPYGLTEAGEPTFLISAMAMHTRNLETDPRATLLISSQGSHSASLLGDARASILGDVAKVESGEFEEIARRYIARNPQAQAWLRFGDFSFYKMTVRDVYYVGGFGVMGWVGRQPYLAASPDPLAEAATELVRQINTQYRDSLNLLVAQHGLEANAVEVTSIDRFGFGLEIDLVKESPQLLRIPFPAPVESPQDALAALQQMTQAARLAS